MLRTTTTITSVLLISFALTLGGCKKQTSESKGLLPPPPLKATGKATPGGAGAEPDPSKGEPGKPPGKNAPGGEPGKAPGGEPGKAPGKAGDVAAAGGENAAGKAGAPGQKAAATAGKGAPSPPPTPPRWKCGNGTCEVLKGEDCIVCADDCGKCNGCQKKADPLCPGCKCENCVCAKVATCCAKNGAWGDECVKACKEQCGGCGLQ